MSSEETENGQIMSGEDPELGRSVHMIHRKLLAQPQSREIGRYPTAELDEAAYTFLSQEDQTRQEGPTIRTLGILFCVGEDTTGSATTSKSKGFK